MYGKKMGHIFGSGTGTGTGYFQVWKYGYGFRTRTRTSGFGAHPNEVLNALPSAGTLKISNLKKYTDGVRRENP